jgi:hypothetical protein
MPAIGASDPFEMSQLDDEPQYKGKGKRPLEQDGEKGGSQGKPPAKKVKKGCAVFTTRPLMVAHTERTASFCTDALVAGQWMDQPAPVGLTAPLTITLKPLPRGGSHSSGIGQYWTHKLTYSHMYLLC